jgi:hypothetical protein
MHAHPEFRHVLLEERDLRILLFLWEAERPVKSIVSCGMFSSAQAAARRINKLVQAKLLNRGRTDRTNRNGRPLAQFATDKKRFLIFLNNHSLLREWLERLVESNELPTDWEQRMRRHADIAYATSKKGKIMKSSPTSASKKLFVSYSHANRKALDSLTPHLALLEQRGYIEPWDDRQLIAGAEFHSEICKRLNKADVILLIVSTEFLISKYIRETELHIALTRWKEKKSIVLWVPLENRDLLEKDEQEAAIKKLLACTPNAKPIRDFKTHKDGWLEVEKALQRVIENFPPECR